MDKTIRSQFRASVLNYFEHHGRHDLPWRLPESDGSFDPYKTMVSELMLQQTQVGRVVPKYHEFLMAFPTAQQLAAAELGDVLKLWSGLGYNRRAKFLWQAAKIVDQGNYFPETVDELTKLPGIGRNTAGAILAYSFNQPTVFIETNIRTVYIYHFFADQTVVDDKAILPLLEQTLETDDPRIFYWALMDYGSHLKATVGNLSRTSKHYAKQSTFQGSRRQIRGQVLKLLGQQPQSAEQLARIITDDRLPAILSELVAESLIQEQDEEYRL